MLTAGRHFRGKLLHLAEGPVTGFLNPPVMQERTTLCGQVMRAQWKERLARKYMLRPECEKCAAKANSPIAKEA